MELAIKKTPEKGVWKSLGTYEIKVKGYSGTDKKYYDLQRDGSAVWKMTGSCSAQKSGKWTASDGEIILTIKGNSVEIKLNCNISISEYT